MKQQQKVLNNGHVQSSIGEVIGFAQKSGKINQEKLRDMVLAIAGGPEAVLAELTLRKDLKQPADAKLTLEVFVPIANRLGLGEIKRSLEDPAFAVLMPEKFSWLQSQLKDKYEERQKYLKRFIPKLKKILQHERLAFSDIHFRPKSYWSTWQKLQRHQMDFEKLHDLVAIRVIVKDVAACYKVLGILHKYFQPISGHIQDYIAKPKENGYQSLHTTVYLEPEKYSEIQIKTEEMHREAEHGSYAHWAYKEKISAGTRKGLDFFEDQVFVFTPKGDIIKLPKGSTPIDFAYAVHSDIGNHCEGAKVGGKIVPLSYQMQNGDVLEIITKKDKVPSASWLSFVKTGFAKNHIRKIITSTSSSIFYIPSYIKKKIFGSAKKTAPAPVATNTPKPIALHIAGQTGIMVTVAKCCLPQRGDAAKAYLGRQRTAMLHKVSCENFIKLSAKFPGKVVEASWEEG